MTAVSANSATSKPPFTPVYAAASSSYDDHTLRQIFDSRAIWQEFSQSRLANHTRSNVGLFQNRYLTSPDGFDKFAKVTESRCLTIVEKILSTDVYPEIAKDFDRLSDLLCRIIDLADFVRSAHPDLAWQNAASNVHMRLAEYMNRLNSTPGLNEQLKRATADTHLNSIWSEEEATVANMLLKDFSRSAIDCSKEQRDKFVKVSSKINRLGDQLLHEAQLESRNLSFESSQLKGMDPTQLKHLGHKRGKVVLPLEGTWPTTALCYVEDETVRKQIYIASRTASTKSTEILEELMQSRVALARISGYSDYASMNLTDKMAQTPEAVGKFLEACSANSTGHVKREVVEMLKLRAAFNSRTESPSQMNAWDRDFYRTKLASKNQSSARRSDDLSAYLSLGTVMQGLSRLFTRLYGVRLVPHEPQPGETWDPDVRRLDVMDEDHGHIAVVYCDLFSRPGKSPHAAHFTVRCSRLISSSEIAEAGLAGSDSPLDLRDMTPSQLANDGMCSSTPSASGAIYQLPTIVLTCDFSPPPSPSWFRRRPTLLSLPQLSTLFHEMGHAIHSILGRTNLHNVAGTRVSTDFAEFPSMLMEHMATDPSVLGLFARHWETDAPLPHALVEEQVRTRLVSDDEPILLNAMLDQAYHSSIPLSPSFDSSAVYHDIQRRHGNWLEPLETRPQSFISHLVGYGGTYYAYLFDGAIARRVWDVVFESGREGMGINRERGERMKEEVLRWGGSRDPWLCLARVLGDAGACAGAGAGAGAGLEGGGETAMAEVGRWGAGGLVGRSTAV